MRRLATAAVCLLVLAGLSTLVVGQPGGAGGSRDYSRVVVGVAAISRGCPPCERLKRDYPGMHQRMPDLWWVWQHEGQRDITIRQYQAESHQYTGTHIQADTFPTVVVYAADEFGQYKERFRMIGYSDRDREVLVSMIQRSAEREQ